MTDLHRILARLQPEPDGEPTLSRRTATLTAINGDGTVQINMSGVDVRARALSGWNMQVGTTVQVLVERGDLLVLGEAITPGGGFVTNITQDVIEFGSADTLVCMPHGIPFQPDPAHFQITARNDPGDTLHWWVDSVDLTDVCIALDQAPGGDLALAWRHIGGRLGYGCADNADIIHDGWAYHVFTATGMFTPTQVGIFDVLIVGGGGGGGGTTAADFPSGGGGAGGVIMQTGWAISGPTTATVGTGGTGGAAGGGNDGTNGGDSIFDVLTALGGGGGGGNGRSGLPGASGGGGSNTGTGGSGTPGQGNDGGNGQSVSPWSSGAGGGAGTAGSDGTGTGAGGDGVYVAEFDAPGLGSPQGWFGGGGGGGRRSSQVSQRPGGAGGGGNGRDTSQAGFPGVDGTGGGGGAAGTIPFGSGPGNPGGDGGDGIIVIRHPVCTP